MPGVRGRPRPPGAVVTGLTAVLGHMFTFWLSFKGGKGVAYDRRRAARDCASRDARRAGRVPGCVLHDAIRLPGLDGGWGGFVATMLIQMSRTGVWDSVLLGFGVLVMLLVILRHKAEHRTHPRGHGAEGGEEEMTAS